eukprot:73036-Chlamydomonas_euryale.AAC.1
MLSVEIGGLNLPLPVQRTLHRTCRCPSNAPCTERAVARPTLPAQSEPSPVHRSPPRASRCPFNAPRPERAVA